MPNKDGYQTCKDIRRWERKQRLSRLPIIALSANVMSDVVERCHEAGFSDYVAKPVDFKALTKAMTELMDGAEARGKGKGKGKGKGDEERGRDKQKGKER